MGRQGHKILGKSIPEWADIIGISYMSAYEKIRGHREFRIWELKKLQETLGLKSIDVLLEELEKEREKTWKKKEQKQ